MTFISFFSKSIPKEIKHNITRNTVISFNKNLTYKYYVTVFVMIRGRFFFPLLIANMENKLPLFIAKTT